eukprot:tig00020723_g13463.t1
MSLPRSGRPSGSGGAKPPPGIAIGVDIEPASKPCSQPGCGGSRQKYGGKCLHCGQHFCTRDALYSHVLRCRHPAASSAAVKTRAAGAHGHAFSERPECGDCQQKSKATGSKDVWGCDLCAAHFVRFGPAKVVAHHATASCEKNRLRDEPELQSIAARAEAARDRRLGACTRRARAAGCCGIDSACWQSQPRLAARLQSLHGQAAASGGRRLTPSTTHSGTARPLCSPAQVLPGDAGPPAPIAALPAPQLPEDDDEDTPKRRSGGRKATVISSDESDNASATGDDPIEVSSDEEGAAPELDAAEAPVVKSASAPKKATGMKGLMALAAPRLLGTKAARLLGAGVSKGKKTKKPAAPKAAKSKDTKGGKKTKAVQ